MPAVASKQGRWTSRLSSPGGGGCSYAAGHLSGWPVFCCFALTVNVGPWTSGASIPLDYIDQAAMVGS